MPFKLVSKEALFLVRSVIKIQGLPTVEAVDNSPFINSIVNLTVKIQRYSLGAFYRHIMREESSVRRTVI